MYDKKRTEYTIKQVGDRYYPVIIDKEAGVHYEIKNSLTGGVLSYKNIEGCQEVYVLGLAFFGPDPSTSLSRCSAYRPMIHSARARMNRDPPRP